ncbi:MAG: helix-turn-helix transcriptional regulator [Pyrinomonadaceae bacterium]
MDRRVQIVQAAVETNCRREWTNQALGDLVNLSPSRLRHLFKSETGKTPTQFLKAVRLREAEKLLRMTFLSVKEIMNRVGFLDESHFGHEFKKVYGLAPSKYRSLTPARDVSE